MKKHKHLFAKIMAVLGIVVSALYLLLLFVSQFVTLPFEIANNVLFADWLFIAIPVIGFVCAIALQIASVHKKKKKKQQV
jgi:cytochrome bd-type quinol oxidase subunit 2